jgi:hypothetical protein
MNNNNKKIILFKSVFIFIGFLLAAWTIYDNLKVTEVVNGAAPSGMKTEVASSTTAIQVGPQQIVTLFNSSDCTSRVISTFGRAITIYFATSTSDSPHADPSINFGQLVATTTTQTLDAGLYGCSVVRAYSDASTTISVTEFKGWR